MLRSTVGLIISASCCNDINSAYALSCVTDAGMSRCPAAIAAWLGQRTGVRLSPVRTFWRSAELSITPARSVHSDARRSPAVRSSSYQPISSLLPVSAYTSLVSRLGQQHVHRELSWMIEAITRTPLATLRSQQQRSSLSSLIRSLPPQHLFTLHSFVQQRASGVPLQYVLGDVGWGGLSVLCRAPTLIPRPETEEMVDWICSIVRAPTDRYTRASDWPTTSPSVDDSITARRLTADGTASLSSLRALDLCTGSGCISLALSAHLGCTTLGTDIAHAALQLAADNRAHIEQQLPDRRTLHSTFQYDDVCSSQLPPHSFDLIVANPPYIATADIATLQPEVQHHESTLALDGGSSGTQLYPAIAALAARVLQPADRRPGVGWPELVVEIGGDEQRTSVMECFRAAGFVDCAAFMDRAGRTRWIAGRRR